MISRALMLRFYSLSSGDADAGKISLYNDALRNGSHGYFPEDYGQFLGKMRNSPLFEITESIISYFNLGINIPGNVAYLTLSRIRC